MRRLNGVVIYNCEKKEVSHMAHHRIRTSSVSLRTCIILLYNLENSRNSRYNCHDRDKQRNESEDVLIDAVEAAHREAALCAVY